MSQSPLPARARVTGWGTYAVLLFVLSVIVHAGTFVGHSLSLNTPYFIGMSLGIFPVFIALVLRSRRWQRERNGPFGLRYRQIDWREWRPFLPIWAPRVVLILGTYAMANFVFAALHLPLRGAGAVLTESQAMYMTRMFSGHWLVFYGVPALFFAYVPNKTLASNALPHAEA